VLLIIGVVLIGLMSVSFILSGTIRDTSKLSGYECGLEPMGDAKVKLKIVYYIITFVVLLTLTFIYEWFIGALELM